jgi:hypothetical protein
MATESARSGEPSLDAAALYREEVYTDRKIGTLRVLLPVTAAGDPDPARATVQRRSSTSPTCGTAATSFDIDATSLADGIAIRPAAKLASTRDAERWKCAARRRRLVIPQGGGTAARRRTRWWRKDPDS